MHIKRDKNQARLKHDKALPVVEPKPNETMLVLMLGHPYREHKLLNC